LLSRPSAEKTVMLDANLTIPQAREREIFSVVLCSISIDMIGLTYGKP
jgi:hypothetical protein